MEIQPRSLADSIADLIGMLGKVWRPLLMPALVASGVVTIVAYLVLQDPVALDFLALAFEDPEALERMSEAQLREVFMAITRAGMIIGFTSLAVYGVLFLAAARAVAEHLAVAPSGDSVVGSALSSLVSWAIAFILLVFAVTAGLVLFIIPGIWLAVSMSMVAPVVAVEKRGPLGAIRRSFTLVKGNWWETFGFLLLVGLIGATATQLIQFLSVPMLMVGNPSFAFGLTLALGVALQGLIIAAIGVGAAIWYFNLTARTDGVYELQLT
jgi:hypothetical protein